ncbi:Na+/H+ antiporter NhaA [Novosphingobium tardum]|uniref:Na(+)/H(+) antiporter NhaA n=1 Tax=Novosphingobium tardum TaxID=1538021 RepID=A0ABV8RM93_9SPHN
MSRRRRLALSPRLRALAHSEAAPGVLLMAVTLVALGLANSALAHDYHALFHDPLAIVPIARLNTVHALINDGLMAVFFFVVGLEIKREIVTGALADAAARRLPVVAAAAGMAVPAAVYLLITRAHPELHRGWAIPAATDIAFAMGVLALLGKRIPPSIRLFLLTVAIVDDLGAVLIIALAYTARIDGTWLIASLVILVAMIGLARMRVERALPYVILATLLWYAVLNSGVHATIAGVAAALTIPVRVGRKSGDSLLLRMEHALVPWNGFLIVPLFALANAGVSLAGTGVGAFADPLPLAIALGLVVGKQAGIFGTLIVAERLGESGKLAGASWQQLWGMALLCGIGFTMSLFIGALAFPSHPQLVEEAKLGVLAGSLLSALAGFAVLRSARPVTTAAAS